MNDLNLTVRRGEIFGFLGPNGAGKSTTIRMILSLIRPTTGRAELFGSRLTSRHRTSLARVGGLVERPDLYLYLSARRNLDIVAGLMGGKTTREIDSVLDIVGLLPRAGDKVKTYSHGMKQRLGIAQALLGDPEFVVLDEPTSGLDPQGIKEVRDLILRLSADKKITIFLSSHLLSEIEQTATSMAIINRGHLVVQGRVRDLLDDRESLVRLDVEPMQEALTILGRLPFVSRLEGTEGRISCMMPRARVAEINRLLVQENILVHALIPRRSLEEYFLRITEGESDVKPPVRPIEADRP